MRNRHDVDHRWKGEGKRAADTHRDLNIPAAAHAFMAKRANSRETVEVKGASYVVTIAHPDVVARVIEHAASSVNRMFTMQPSFVRRESSRRRCAQRLHRSSPTR